MDDFCVISVLKSSCTNLYTPVFRAIIPRNRLMIITFVFLSFFSFEAYAYPSAWNIEEGKWQVIHSITTYETDSFYNINNIKVDVPDYKKIEYNPYVEYGFDKDLTIGFSPRLDYATREALTGKEKVIALESIEFFARKKFWQDKDTVFSIQPLVKLPGFYSEGKEQLLGEKQIDLELRLLAGHSFSMKWKPFVNIEAAYRSRAEKPEDQWRFDGAIGIRPAEKWLILGQWFTTLAVHQPDTNSFAFNNGNDYNLLKLQASGIYDVSKDISLQLGVFQNTWVENTGGGGGIIFSVWQRF